MGQHGHQSRMRTYIYVGAVVAALGVLYWAVLPTNPSGTEQQMAQAQSAAPQGAPIVEVVLPPELSSNAKLGKTIFEATCAACHGINAAGQEGVAPPLVHKIYGPSHHGDESFWIATQRGVRAHHWRFGDMPRIEGLTRADVMMVVAYIRELQRENGIK